jgi:hypothetical protein
MLPIFENQEAGASTKENYGPIHGPFGSKILQHFVTKIRWLSQQVLEGIERFGGASRPRSDDLIVR